MIDETKLYQSRFNGTQIDTAIGKVLERGIQASDVIADVPTVSTKNTQAVLTAFDARIADRYTKAESNALAVSGTNELVQDVSVDITTGVIKVTKKDGTFVQFDTALEKVPASFQLMTDIEGTWLVITNVDGTTSRANVTQLIGAYTFSQTAEIAFITTETGGTKSITANLRDASVSMAKLNVQAVGQLEGYVTEAQSQSTAAKAAAVDARTAATAAAASVTDAKTAVTDARAAAADAAMAKTAAQLSETEAVKSAQEAKRQADLAVASRDHPPIPSDTGTWQTYSDGIYHDSLKPWQGPKGEMGNIGKTGAQGIQGIQGVTGATGPAATALSVNATLLLAGWSSATPTTQTVSMPGMTATTSGAVGLSQSATAEQRDTARLARLIVSAQGTDSITVTADGETPTMDIPLTAILY